MLHSRENTLHLTQLSMAAIEQLSPSFSYLPNTGHADGQYRLRRYSVVQFKDGQIVDLKRNQFVQSSDINRFQGDVVREFAPIEPAIMASEGFGEMCDLFVSVNHLPDGQEIEVHQIRIAAIEDETQVAPEGVHQDGFDHIALVGVGRHNIIGGDIMLYSSSNQAPFFRKVLENGEVAILADGKLWHNACPIRSVNNDQEGYMDVFVLTATDKRNEFHS
ncbi:2OG-Fe dioxygenase family protein [Vibrio sp. CAU 1672]|uniref:2OG-Fe dioxygenase family protein n=1 Tax=Vibrio sp. CAU 1672 TaxID=3032594 RepID=UPI0023DBB3CB|nr:2OG-Fe dioxygenase family protein [Vibrio sp. CAU 1672]MDF2152374.1 2OG-Fe dioxygenase family protein [Vibrio sp. CAU 1672]